MATETGRMSELDAKQGVAESSIEEDRPVLARLGEEPVVLVKHGEESFAVGAACTHYGGPLADGLVVGETIRCPWHHACFSLRTGEAVRPPALTPIPRYAVERTGGRVRVADRLPEKGPVVSPGGPESVVIIGTGAAGNAAAEALRAAGYGGRVTVVGREADPPYDRPNLSKDYLAGKAPEEWIPLHPAAFYEERGIELRLGSPVVSIDGPGRTVALADGERLPWGALLIATGAEPVPLAVPGADLPHVQTLRTLADSSALIARARGASRLVVVGASFIGLEVAAALVERGLDVHVVAPSRRPLERVLGPEVGDALRALHEKHGVVFHLGQEVSSITAGKVTLKGGRSIEADLVAVGIGVRPSVALAESAGVAVDRGILVDHSLRTDVPGIFAAGDAARWPDVRTGRRIRVEHWVLAERMGQAAALGILGRQVKFDAVPFFWSAHYDVVVSYVGHAEEWDGIDVHGSPAAGDATVAYRLGGKTLAVATIGRDRTSLEAEVDFERGDEAALQAYGVSR